MIKNRSCPKVDKPKSVLLIDGANLNIIVNQKNFNISNIINYIIFLYKKFLPNKIVIVFEGMNSLERRRKIYPLYKKNTDVMYNYKQLDLLRNLPIHYLSIKKLEADDVISIITSYHFKDYNKIIVSSDKDYYQLLDSNTTIYNPITKVEYNLEWFNQTYNICPNNFLYYKAILGDKSDNIVGVRGLGKEKFNQIFNEYLNDVWESDFVYDKIDSYISKKEFYELLSIIRQPNLDMYSLHEIECIDSELNRTTQMQMLPIIKECKNTVEHKELIKLISLGC